MLITTGVLALLLGLMVVLTPPGSAATTTIDQGHGMFGGDPGLKLDGPDAISVPAGPSTEGPGRRTAPR